VKLNKIVVLGQWEKARQAIAKCKNIDEVKIIRDKAEALRAYAKQAKESLEVQNNVCEIKLRAERRIGEFSRELPMQRGKYQQTPHDGESDKLNILKDAGISHHERYETIASIPEEDFENHIQEIKGRCDELTTVGLIKAIKGKAHVAYSSGDNEWYTPAQYIESALVVMGNIDIDPASSKIANAKIKAQKYYTLNNDGLSKKWVGKVWLNPPYAQPAIDNFCDKLLKEIECGNCTEAIVLVNNATETKWFQKIATKSTAICFNLGRIKFWAPEKISAPLQGQALLYFGKNWERFKKEFGKYGIVFTF